MTFARHTMVAWIFAAAAALGAGCASSTTGTEVRDGAGCRPAASDSGAANMADACGADVVMSNGAGCHPTALIPDAAGTTDACGPDGGVNLFSWAGMPCS